MQSLKDMVERCLVATRAADRQDLTDRLSTTRDRLADSDVRILVVGEFKKGKSMLIKELLDAPICPIDDDVATAVPTVIRHGPELAATLVFGTVGAINGRGLERTRPGAPERRQKVPVNELTAYLTEAGNPENERQLSHAEVTSPRKLLEGGVVLVDTPGVGGINSAHSTATLSALVGADAVIMVSDAAQEYSEPEIEFLRQAVRLCPNVACVLTKIDLYPDWRHIAELDRRHLQVAGIKAPLLCLSSSMRMHALANKDRELNNDSGFPALTKYLQTDILAKSAQLSRNSVLNDVRYVTEHLAVSVRGEIAALQDPDGNAELLVALEKAKEQMSALRKRSSRWQNLLNDGVTDLISDIEYDFRDRVRILIRDAEEIIDGVDPGETWDQFAEWLEQRTASAVADNFVWAHERAEWLAGQVSECFAATGGTDLPRVLISDTAGVLDPVGDLDAVPADSVRLGGQLLIGMRGSYGGVLMFGLLTGAMGFALLNPFSLGAGVLLGVKSVRDDKKNRLARRQAEAKMIVRRQLDDVSMHVLKQSRDRLRTVQRTLRDHFTEIADEMHRSLSESVEAAQRAARINAVDRERQTAALQLRLRQIEAMWTDARALTAAPPTSLSAA